MQRLLLGFVILATVACGDAPAVDAPAGGPDGAATAVRAAQRVRAATVSSEVVGGLSDIAGLTSAFRSATVAAEVAARVVTRHVEPGASVAAGDPLVGLDETLLVIAVDEARAQLRAREVDRAEARQERARGDELLREGAISSRQHDTLKFAVDRARSARDLAQATLRRAERALADSTVRAPYDGTVERVLVNVGDYLVPGTPIATVADFSRVRFEAGVTAAEAALLAAGHPAAVALPSLGGLELVAPIHHVGRLADPQSGTYPVEVWLENGEGRLRAGMVGRLRLDADEQAAVAVVPRAAVLRRAGALAVFVVEGANGDARAVARPVRLGRRSDERVEVLDGLRVGERVVVEGLFALTDGASVVIDNVDPERATWND